MKEPCCAICKVGSINCDGNGWHPFKNSLTCCWITSTASSTTAAQRYASESWKPSTATSKPSLEGAVATRISAICCSRPNAWRSPRPNSSFCGKQPKMRVSTNSRAEPNFLTGLLSVAVHQVFDQQRNIVNALAQCRQTNRENVQALVQIPTECA